MCFSSGAETHNFFWTQNPSPVCLNTVTVSFRISLSLSLSFTEPYTSNAFFLSRRLPDLVLRDLQQGLLAFWPSATFPTEMISPLLPLMGLIILASHQLQFYVSSRHTRPPYSQTTFFTAGVCFSVIHFHQVCSVLKKLVSQIFVGLLLKQVRFNQICDPYSL